MTRTFAKAVSHLWRLCARKPLAQRVDLSGRNVIVTGASPRPIGGAAPGVGLHQHHADGDIGRKVRILSGSHRFRACVTATVASEVRGPNRGDVRQQISLAAWKLLRALQDRPTERSMQTGIRLRRVVVPVGKTGCSYRNTDGLTGVLAPMVFLCFGGYMRRGFDEAAEGLKARAEAIQAETVANG